MYNYLFPTCIFSDTQKELATEMLPVANEYLQNHGKQFRNYANHISTYGDVDITNKLNRDPRLSSLTNFIVTEGRKLLEFQNVDSSEYRFTVSYLINKIGKDATHQCHSHPGSILSGCFYLKTVVDSPPLIFKDPREYYKYIYYKQVFGRNSAYTLLPEHAVTVHDGLIMIWPSWLEHEVPLSSSDCDRITIAFNLDR